MCSDQPLDYKCGWVLWVDKGIIASYWCGILALITSFIWNTITKCHRSDGIIEEQRRREVQRDTGSNNTRKRRGMESAVASNEFSAYAHLNTMSTISLWCHTHLSGKPLKLQLSSRSSVKVMTFPTTSGRPLEKSLNDKSNVVSFSNPYKLQNNINWIYNGTNDPVEIASMCTKHNKY